MMGSELMYLYMMHVLIDSKAKSLVLNSKKCDNLSEFCTEGACICDDVRDIIG